MRFSRELLKSIPGIAISANLYRGLLFVKRASLLRIRLTKIDKHLPFKGILFENGHASFQISKNSLTSLRILLKRNEVTINDTHKPVFLIEECETALEEIFDLMANEVRAYLGPEAYLDGINWMVSPSNYKSISGNWHTDNVGNRLKLFVCVSGDGSQPTFIIPSRERIPPFMSWLKQTFVEAFRWFGMTKNKKIEGEIALRHSTGTAFLFDTQLLHRGGYEMGASARIIFHMEFSNPKKHKISRGPIGSKSFNSFQFSPALLKIKSFETLLDPERLRVSEDICYYGI